MNCRSYIKVQLLLLAGVGCRDDARSPTGPAMETSQQSVSAAALTFLQVSAGNNHSCGLTTDNRAYCWGYNQFGQLGSGTNTGPEQCEGAVGPFPCSARPVPVVGGHRFRRLSAGSFHTCGVTTDNRGFCWGGNGGRLGDGTTTDRYSPVAVTGGRSFRQIEAGYAHSCAVGTDNRAFCWGGNAYGQLGDGTTAHRLSPVAVAGGHSFRQVSTGSGGNADFTCGVTTSSRAYCWGRNNFGQVGDGSSAARRVRPSRVSSGRRFRQVDAGDEHACAVTTDKRAFCWGNGRDGQLGNGRTYLSFWPRAVAGGLSFERVTAGGVHTCAENTTNRAYCWGVNNSGQLGDGTQTRRLTPVAVAGGHFFEQLSAGGLHTCGKSSGSAYCWGYGFFGQLGNGTSGAGAESSRPVAVLGPS